MLPQLIRKVPSRKKARQKKVSFLTKRQLANVGSLFPAATARESEQTFPLYGRPFTTSKQTHCCSNWYVRQRPRPLSAANNTAETATFSSSSDHTLSSSHPQHISRLMKLLRGSPDRIPICPSLAHDPARNMTQPKDKLLTPVRTP